MKRVIAILLVAVWLVQPVLAGPPFNDATLDWIECAHEYDNACDPTCNKCPTRRTVPDHVVNGPACSDRACIHCGAVVAATAAHTYDHACDTTCNGCGGVRTVEPHAYSAAVTTPATCGADGVMTYTCSICGDAYTEAIAATGKHSYDNACDDLCNVCGAQREVPDHVFESDASPCCAVCGAVRVDKDPSATPGDVNGDGEVNNRDLVLMVRYLNGWKVQIHLSAAEVNGDGVYNIRDIARMQQYLNGWDVEIV